MESFAGKGHKLNEADQRNLTKRIEREFTRLRRGKPLVPGFPVDIKNFEPTIHNLKFVHDLCEERICSVYELPPAIVGLGTGLEHADTRAAHATMLKQAWELGVIPVQDTLAMQWVEQVLPLFRLDSRYRLRFDRSGIEALQDDKEQVFRRWGNAYQRGLAMRSEGRQALGLQVRPEDEVFVEEVKAASNPMALPAPADSPPRSLPSGRRALTEENIALIAAMERIRERAERAMTAGLKEALDELGPLVSAEYRRIVEEEGLRQVPDDLDLAEIERIVDKVMSGWVGWAGDWEKSRWDKAWEQGLESTTIWMRTGLAIPARHHARSCGPAPPERYWSLEGYAGVWPTSRRRRGRSYSASSVTSRSSGCIHSRRRRRSPGRSPPDPGGARRSGAGSSPALRPTSPRTSYPWTPTDRADLPTLPPSITRRTLTTRTAKRETARSSRSRRPRGYTDHPTGENGRRLN